ncbi:alpha/beta hydrolase [Piscinibacterium candidicorallinum]|uniref:Proline iminopeptidase n=1 Tax=Piscinibacterium candidicorallinum TaxID=1793872 RepID=A0ABV7H1R9_9BURK
MNRKTPHGPAPARRAARLAIAAGSAAMGLTLLAACKGPQQTDPLLAATTACRLPDLEQEARCGSVKVKENPANPGSREIEVKFAVLPAQARYKEPDPIVLLAGGPGQHGLKIAAPMSKVFGALNRKRDLIFIDQRGTGQSNGLECPMRELYADMDKSLDPQAQIAVINRCQQTLAANNDLAGYATHIAVQDFDAIRAKLGAERINLWGGSYGTRAAIEYTRQFPQRVRTLMLDGVAPADMPLPVSIARDGDAMVSNLIEACAKDAACAKRYPDFAQRVDALFTQPTSTLALTDAYSGQKKSYTVPRNAVVSALRTPLYAPGLSAMLPQAVARAAAGDGDPMLALSNALAGGMEDEMSMGMHLAVVCAEDLPQLNDANIAQAAKTRFGTAFVEQYRGMCKGFPQPQIPAAYYAPVKHDRPTLVLSGGLDPVTPPAEGNKVTGWFSDAQHLVAPNIGHIVSGQPCASKLIETFVKTEGKEKLDGTCLAKLPRPTFYEPPQRPSADAPKAGNAQAGSTK